jgi:phosphoglucosamine mutase
VQAVFDEIEAEIGDFGRVLLRESGTEPVIRIMVEYKDEGACADFVKRLEKALLESEYD